MKRILIIVAVLLILLSGCANNTVQPPTGTETVNDSTTDTFPQVEKETTSSQAASQESSVNIDSLEESTQDTDESKTVQTESGNSNKTTPDTKPKEEKVPSIKDSTTSSQAETTSVSTKNESKPVETKPREPEKPKEAETPKKEEPAKEKEKSEPVETKASFDINYWISFAKEAAVSKGLTLESSAVDCWDNPITANSDCIYLDRDINSRLNRYAGDEDITDVWIWYECVGENSYLIYIGYA
jgi:DNA polymerase III gamma/tau subunit